MSPYPVDPALIARFAADLDLLAAPGSRVGIAVSGGPDSLALLLLASAARPGAIEASTVDHQLRVESAEEVRFVAGICKTLGVRHQSLLVDVAPRASVQAQARYSRYRALGDWAIDRSLPFVATAHHTDDQAETLLMRLARGAGLSGLAGTRRRRPLERGITLIRPLLDWRRAELAALVESAGIEPIDDPSNRDLKYDRSRFRGMLEQAEWAEAERLALSARWLADADEAIEWALAPLVEQRIERADGGLAIDAAGLPRELQRRLLLAGFSDLGAPAPRGPELDRAMRALASGGRTTLAGLKLEGGAKWSLRAAPPRRKGK